MHQNPYLAVIDPAMHKPETECLNQISFWSKIPVTYHLPKISGIESLLRLQADPKAIIVLGSASSVHDRHPWQIELETWLKPRLEKGIPALGLCYGHQMLCYMFGGKIAYVDSTQTKLTGLREIQLKAHALWGSALTGRVVVSHCEHVAQAPKDFEVIGSSQVIQVEAVAHKRLPIWGFQAHPEATSKIFFKKEGDRAYNLEELQFGHRLMKSFMELVNK